MNPSAGAQLELLGEFSTRQPGNPLFCHQEFLEQLEANRNNAVGKKAAHLLHRLVVDERRLYYKGTLGANRGWRRSRLGGHGGNQFYAWWAPRRALPFQGLAEFENAPEGSLLVRAIRHHDDHSPLLPQSLEQNYLPVGAKELRQQDYVPGPWTGAQARFATARQPVRIVKGYPGSGKTTALWHAADQAGPAAVLYVTYSPDLASLARDHFDRFSSAEKQFHVITFAQLLRQILGRDLPLEPLSEARQRFLKATGGMSPRILGPWLNSREALYDEMHAHLAGSALPIGVGRFPASTGRHLADRVYRDQRQHAIGRVAAEAALETASSLRKRDDQDLELRFFPELCLAWDAVQSLASPGLLDAGRLPEFGCLVLDEAQDLTPIETLAFLELAAAARRKRSLSVLIAGDEAQTVRPTDFDWGWFHDLVHHRIGTPAEYKLGANLRSPRRIAEALNRVWNLYSHIAKQERPGSLGPVDTDEGMSDQIVFCAARPGPELEQLLQALTEREGLAVISLGDEIPAYVPESLRGRVLSVFEAKGLDFQSVCILDAGSYLEQIVRENDRVRREAEIAELSKRLAIDRLRVALSRPTERLYWLEVDPRDRPLDLSRKFLSGDTLAAEVFPVIPAAVLKTLEEELLLPEERVRLCEGDARQLLEVKPALAWTRAQQAVALAEVGGAVDEAARRSAHLTAAEVAFRLAYRGAALGPELGRPDLYAAAARHADFAARNGLAEMLRGLGELERCPPERYLPQLTLTLNAIAGNRGQFEAWLETLIAPKVSGWMERLEENLNDAFWAKAMAQLLPQAYQVFRLPDAESRAARLRQRAVDALIRFGSFDDALQILVRLPQPDHARLAVCHEGAGDFASAAECHLQAGHLKEALRNYRSIPDFPKALELIEKLKDHPAAESLRWVRRMQQLAAERPAEFNRVTLPPEKKLLEEILETSLGVARKKPAPKKATAKPGRPKGAATKKTRPQPYF